MSARRLLAVCRLLSYTLASWVLKWRLVNASHALGEVAAQQELAGCGGRAAHDALARLQHSRATKRLFDEENAASLQRDRADYLQGPGWLRWGIVLRGWIERAILRERIWRARRALRSAHAAVGQQVLAGGVTCVGGTLHLPDSLRLSAEAALQHHQAMTDRIAKLQSEFGGQVMPAGIRWFAKAALGIGWSLGREVSSKLLPRVPALAGLAVGWWLTATFTDSHFDAVLSHLGLRHGATRVLSRSQLERLNFWLPLLAGACCSYLSSQISSWRERRYGPGAVVAQNVDSSHSPTLMLPAIAQGQGVQGEASQALGD